MSASYDATADTVFASCDTIMKNFVFLTQMVENLDDSHFEFIPKSQVRKQKNLILQELELDTAFKLLSKLEAEIKSRLQRHYCQETKRFFVKEIFRVVQRI